MKHRMLYRLLAGVVFIFVLASTGLAHNVVIDKQAKLGNGPELQPGTYRLEIVKNQDASEAVFYQGKDVVARAPITIVTESEKSRHNEVHYEVLGDGRVINQIRVAGWKERLVFRERGQTPVVAE